jgi:hypothetical protein
MQQLNYINTYLRHGEIINDYRLLTRGPLESGCVDDYKELGKMILKWILIHWTGRVYQM